MTKLKVANLNYLSALPYTLLAENESIEYQEVSSRESARLLHEGLVDLALISVSDFAIHGGYLALEFGLGCQGESSSLLLCSNQSLQDIKTIYVDEGLSSSVALLRLLACEKWKIAPKIVRSVTQVLSKNLAVGEAAFFVAEPNSNFNPKKLFHFVYDLGQEWFRHTKKPAVFSLWATRPETLNADEYQFFNDLFHKCNKAKSVIAQNIISKSKANQAESVEYVCNKMIHYLDEDLMSGLDDFFKRSYKHKILPQAAYAAPKKNLFNFTSNSAKKKSSRDVLNDVALGKRLTMRDAVLLAEESDLVDLACAAELSAKKLGLNKQFAICADLSALFACSHQAIDLGIEHLVSQGVSEVFINLKALNVSSLEDLENFIHKVKRAGLTIEIKDILDLVGLARMTNLGLNDILARLITAGAEILDASSCSMIVEKARGHFELRGLTNSEILLALQWQHRCWGKTVCGLRVSSQNSWSERLIHIDQIRNLQDENPGVRYFRLDLDHSNPVSEQDLLRCYALSRIFLDNIAYIEGGIVGSFVDLHYGANAIRLILNNNQNEAEVGYLKTLGFDPKLVENKSNTLRN